MSPSHRRCRGLTLIELLFTVAIVGITLAVGLPALADALSRTAVTTTSASLTAALAQARTAAVSFHQPAVLCPTSDHLSCARATRWDGGWMVFLDPDRDGRRGDAERLLWASDGADRDISIASTRGRLAVTYLPDGRSPGSNLTLSICPRTHDVDGRQLVLNNSGRVRSQRFAGCSDLLAAVAAPPP
jgi:type IV fimbrial biogenesis protein FimT